MFRRIAARDWLILTALVGFGPFVYAAIRSLAGSLGVHFLFESGYRSDLPVDAIMYGADVIGAITAAAILVIPIAVLTQRDTSRTVALGVLLPAILIGGAVINSWPHLGPADLLQQVGWLISVASAAFVLACILFLRLASRYHRNR